MECKKRETILNTPVESRSELKCDTREIEMSISRLGEIVEVPVNVPRYDTCHNSVVATGREGSAPGELYYPYGVAIHEETHQIFVANEKNDRVEIFSEMGEFICQLGVGQLSQPWGIAIHWDSVYVSCSQDHTVSKLSLTEMCLVRRIGGEGPKNGHFKRPRQLTTDPIGRVFIADANNNRICGAMGHDGSMRHDGTMGHDGSMMGHGFVTHDPCLMGHDESMGQWVMMGHDFVTHDPLITKGQWVMMGQWVTRGQWDKGSMGHDRSMGHDGSKGHDGLTGHINLIH